MGKPYASELGQLSATLDWAADTDITGIREAVIAASTLPLIAVGSGAYLEAIAYELVAPTAIPSEPHFIHLWLAGDVYTGDGDEA